MNGHVVLLNEDVSKPNYIASNGRMRGKDAEMIGSDLLQGYYFGISMEGMRKTRRVLGTIGVPAGIEPSSVAGQTRSVTCLVC